MAGKIGDGVLINASHPSDIEFAVKMANEGMKQAGKSPSDVDITAYTSFSVNEDHEKSSESSNTSCRLHSRRQPTASA